MTPTGNGAGPASPLQILDRVRQRSPAGPPVGERCDLCAAPVADEHPHVVNVETRALLCTCRPCYLLFTPDGASGGKHRAVPDRVEVLPRDLFAPADWDSLQVPVDVAFFFHNSAMGRVAAFYPSPAGATESLLSLDAWARITAGQPRLASIEPDVEAVLVHRPLGPVGAIESFIVPIDACYELVGLMRKHWRGFDGGQEVRDALDDFFAQLRTRAGADA